MIETTAESWCIILDDERSSGGLSWADTDEKNESNGSVGVRFTLCSSLHLHVRPVRFGLWNVSSWNRSRKRGRKQTNKEKRFDSRLHRKRQRSRYICTPVFSSRLFRITDIGYNWQICLRARENIPSFLLSRMVVSRRRTRWGFPQLRLWCVLCLTSTSWKSQLRWLAHEIALIPLWQKIEPKHDVAFFIGYDFAPIKLKEGWPPSKSPFLFARDLSGTFFFFRA